VTKKFNKPKIRIRKKRIKTFEINKLYSIIFWCGFWVESC